MNQSMTPFTKLRSRLHNSKACQKVAIASFLVSATTCFFAAPANALTFTYVGSWQVGDPGAPLWNDSAFSPDGPPAYTGQEAAALLFGGIASDYAISTISNDPSLINNSSWYSVWGGGPPSAPFAENYSNKYLGQFYGPQSGGSGTASAYVKDWCGPEIMFGNCGINYAFRSTAAVPGPLPLLGVAAAFGYSRGLRRRLSTHRPSPKRAQTSEIYELTSQNDI